MSDTHPTYTPGQEKHFAIARPAPYDRSPHKRTSPVEHCSVGQPSFFHSLPLDGDVHIVFKYRIKKAGRFLFWVKQVHPNEAYQATN